MAGRWGELKFPHIPGAEAAGVVEHAPDGSRFSAGDEVWGRARHAYAEYIVSDGAALALKPDGLSFEDAAALVISGATAHEGIIDRLKLQPGETVIVTSAAGGVGSAGVQIAASTGARVIGVCSAASFDDVRALGATEVFDYHDSGWTEAVREAVPGGADALFDSVGAETGQAALKALRDDARVSLVAYPIPDLSIEGRGISGEPFSAASAGPTFEALSQLIAAGKLRAFRTQVHPLEQVIEKGKDWALIREGTATSWEQSRYDWSKPGLVVSTVEESNFLRPGTTWEFRVSKRPGGGCRVEAVLERDFTGLQGHFVQALSYLPRSTAVFALALRRTLAILEAEEA